MFYTASLNDPFTRLMYAETGCHREEVHLPCD